MTKSNKKETPKVIDDLRGTLKKEQDKLINAKDSAYSRPKKPKGAILKKTSLTSNMCIALLWIYKFYRYNDKAIMGQYYSRKEFFSDLLVSSSEYKNILRNYNYLKYWGLIEPMPTHPTKIIYKKGYWGLTENGVAFCQKEIAMPKYALVYNDFPYEHITSSYIMIDEILKDENLDYNELIKI